ncbi:MAG: D-ala-D-ala transporter subunit [Rhodospirillales bacterium 70-18]|nr:ABC transporter permease [Rhodospirillales bacterium]OJY78391.1 MAG: D-ala-D-ala transporter subunit [Rhodospirillales bacterium 70-18]
MSAIAIPNRHAALLRRLRFVVWTFTASASAMAGLALVAAFLLLAAFGPALVPYPDDARGAMHLAQRLLPPSGAHWFGTDEMGCDILTRVVVGTRTSLWVGLTITGIAAAIGVPLGVAAGYLGGRARATIMRITDVFLAVPGLVLALAIVAALGPGILHGVVALSLVWWPGYVRLIEAKALTLRHEPYVEAARTMGAGHAWVLARHILPNCISPLVVKASMDMGLAILAAASLGFVGLGARPPAPEWGAMIAVARGYMPDWWWYSFFPGLFIFLTVLGFNLLGDGLRDMLDPRSARG